jgi:hypothetical protein
MTGCSSHSALQFSLGRLECFRITFLVHTYRQNLSPGNELQSAVLVHDSPGPPGRSAKHTRENPRHLFALLISGIQQCDMQHTTPRTETRR